MNLKHALYKSNLQEYISLRASQVALVVKNPPVNAGDGKRCRFDPWVVSSPGGGHGNPLQYSCLGNPLDRGAWLATVYGVTTSWTQLRDFHFHFTLRVNFRSWWGKPHCFQEDSLMT